MKQQRKRKETLTLNCFALQQLKYFVSLGRVSFPLLGKRLSIDSTLILKGPVSNLNCS